ncbi:hypothetical protein DRQ09_01245 [candidate division KSB1 bacterium]|nr:MAG: hypothetical protein DRQ09_01245 [candidate division KSB1 bacterium]
MIKPLENILQLIIDKKIFENFPDLNIGVVVAKNINNNGKNDSILDMLKKEQERIKSNYSIEELESEPGILSWRRAYSSFGAKPKKHKCSVENLYRMVLNGFSIKHINNVVDIYNYISIKYMIPVGGDDIDNIKGNITLKYAEGNEFFTPLNSKDIMNPKKGEIIYADDKDVLCRRWNWRECEKSKMTENTKNICLVVEGLPPVSKNKLNYITEELAYLIKKFCGGKVSNFILNITNPETLI